jgi:hypothetical protein
VKLSGEIEDFYVPGDADLIIFWGSDVGVYDIKASWEEKTYHQIQTAVYSIFMNRILPDCNIDCGIVHKGLENFDLESFDEMPSFSRGAREDDVRRLLSGPIRKVYEMDLDDIGYQVDSIRDTKYAEIGFVESIESKHIRMLGLTRGEQKSFMEEGYETIEDVAEIIDLINDPRPYQHDEIPIRDEHKDSVRRLIEEHRLSKNIIQIAQKAQAYLGRINPNHPFAFNKSWNMWIHGSGDGNLPEDDPPYDDNNMNIPRNKLVRVYVNVQYDHVQDVLPCIGYTVTSGKVDYSLTGSDMIEDIVDDREEQLEYEEDMMSNFTSDMFKDILKISQDTGWDDEPMVHFYFYTQDERDSLVECCDRHDSLNKLQDLLSFRGGIEQPMVSIVKDEIENRVATKQLSNGLLPVMESTYPNENIRVYKDDFKYTDENGVEVDLTEAFKTGLFDYNVPISRNGDSIEFNYDYSNSDDYYPLLPRFGASIPLE